jgi:hypothetical protein
MALFNCIDFKPEKIPKHILIKPQLTNPLIIGGVSQLCNESKIPKNFPVFPISPPSPIPPYPRISAHNVCTPLQGNAIDIFI